MFVIKNVAYTNTFYPQMLTLDVIKDQVHISERGTIMFCNSCGTQLPADADFCSNCGAPQEKSADGMSVSAEAKSQPQAPNPAPVAQLSPLPAPTRPPPMPAQGTIPIPSQNKGKSIYEGFGLISAVNICLIIAAISGLLSLFGSPFLTLMQLLERPASITFYPLAVAIINIVQYAALMVVCLNARFAMNNRKISFIDTMYYMTFISLFAYIARFAVSLPNIGTGASAVSSILSFLPSLINQLGGICVSVGVLTLFFAKSQQLKRWFNLEANALRYSSFWSWLSKLPSFMVDESMPNIAQPNPNAQQNQQPFNQEQEQVQEQDRSDIANDDAEM